MYSIKMLIKNKVHKRIPKWTPRLMSLILKLLHRGTSLNTLYLFIFQTWNRISLLLLALKKIQTHYYKFEG